MDLLLPEAERYIEFYNNEELERQKAIIKLFCIYNAESTALGELAGRSKKGDLALHRYASNVQRRFDDIEIEGIENIESQFEEIDGQQD